MSVNAQRLEIVQRNSAAAAQLNRILKDFYIKKIKGKPIETIRDNTEAELDSILSQFMIQSYQKAADSINSKFKGLPYYNLGIDDHTAIENTLRTIEDKFYFRIKQIETRNQGIEFGDITDISLSVTGEIRQKNELDPLVYINGIATGIMFGAHNLAAKVVPQVLVTKVSEKKQQQINEWAWRYVTKNDNQVCDNWSRACKPLEGKIFRMLDPNTPNPPYSQHVWCRCTLILIRS